MSYPLSTNHPSRGPDDNLHSKGESQWGDGARWCHDSHFQVLPCCGVPCCCQAELDILEVGFDKDVRAAGTLK